MSGPTYEMWKPYGSDLWYALAYTVDGMKYGGPFPTREAAYSWIQEVRL